MTKRTQLHLREEDGVDIVTREVIDDELETPIVEVDYIAKDEKTGLFLKRYMGFGYAPLATLEPEHALGFASEKDARELSKGIPSDEVSIYRRTKSITIEKVE